MTDPSYPTPTDPALTDPALTNPASTNPASTNPASTDLASTDLASTDLASTDLASTDDQIPTQDRKGSKAYTENASVDRIPPHQQPTTVERMEGPGGLIGLVKNPYVFATAIFASIGGLLFGYDQGVISGVLVMPQFADKFNLTPVNTGLVVSVLELGCFAGALLNGYFADKISRKYSIVVGAIIFCIGAALQGGAQNVAYLFVGRVIGGLGIGMLSMVVPLYQSEISPPEIRGSLVALQQFAITVGILISFWIDYGTQYMNGDAAWRVPLLIQIACGVFLGVGILMFPFSPRWLMGQERGKDALHVLSRLRRLPEDHPLVQEEWREIKAVVEFDREVLKQRYPEHMDGSRKGKLMIGVNQYKDLFSKGIFKRLVLGAMLQFFQQFTGINAIIYYAPTIFHSIGLQGTEVSLLATGIVGIVNVVFTIPAVLFLDQFGRRPTLLIAAAMLTLSHLVIAILVGLYSSSWPTHTTQGWVAVAFVYFYIANFAYSWGPIGWVYPSEIYPLRIRAKAMSVTTSTNWITNFIIGLITPPMLQAWGFGAYVFFGVFCFISFFWVYFFIPETKGRSLEEMDQVFGDRSAVADSELMARVQDNVAQADVPVGGAMGKPEAMRETV